MGNNQQNDDVVSFDSEELILVDSNDQEIGSKNKALCHDGDGELHRAFSLFVFNEKGELLLQQRSEQKRLWPMYWSNTCCSHPRLGETMSEAVGRRLWQELGMKSELEFVYKFQYHAKFGDLGSEHELCSVYVGKSTAPVNANKNEVAAFRFISPAQLNEELNTHPDNFTPWFKMEWQRLNTEFTQQLNKYCKTSVTI